MKTINVLSYFSSMRRRGAQGVAVLAVVVVAGPALAQLSAMPEAKASAPTATTKNAVTVVLTQSKVVKGTDGKERLLDATTVKPGDVLEYRATYTNRDTKVVKDVVANLPIPEGLVYEAKSAKPGATLVQAATKDGAFSAEPLSRNVGGQIEAVPYPEYRMLRWSLGSLPAGGFKAVSARATVQVYVPPVTAAAQGAASGAQALPVSVVRVTPASKP